MVADQSAKLFHFEQFAIYGGQAPLKIFKGVHDTLPLISSVLNA